MAAGDIRPPDRRSPELRIAQVGDIVAPTLRFTVAWRYDEGSRARVVQVDRGSCALILSDQWPDTVGTGLMFISLNVESETGNAEVAAVDALRAEFEALIPDACLTGGVPWLR